MSTDLYRYVSLSDGDDAAVVGVDEDGVSLVADASQHYVIFPLPRIAEAVADAFRRQGWTAEVHAIPRY